MSFLYPTDRRRRIIYDLKQGSDLDEQQYDAEHAAYMFSLVQALAEDVGLAVVPSSQPKACRYAARKLVGWSESGWLSKDEAGMAVAVATFLEACASRQGC